MINCPIGLLIPMDGIWACEFSDTGWESRQDESGNLLVGSPSGANTASATCSVVDGGASADEN